MIGYPEDLQMLGLNQEEQSCFALQGLTVPVSTIWGTQEEVLKNHNNPIPEYDLTSKDRFVERWNFAGCLAVVIWQAEIYQQAYTPQEYRDRRADSSKTQMSIDKAAKLNMILTSFSKCW